jgi:hypothetical protein
MLLAGGYSQKFSDKVSGKLGAGYLAADKKRKSSATTEAKGKDMATEVNANVNYNISKGLDFGVYGAYAFLGGFYDRAVGEKNPTTCTARPPELRVLNGDPQHGTPTPRGPTSGVFFRIDGKRCDSAN